MVREEQTLIANVEDSACGKRVVIQTSEWTPDYEALTEAVSQTMDIYQLEDGEEIGTAVFDKDADELLVKDIEIDIDEQYSDLCWD